MKKKLMKALALMGSVLCGALALTACDLFGSDSGDNSGNVPNGNPSTPPSDTEHVHRYATSWSSDQASHWHECSCGAKKDSEKHSFPNGSTCDACGYPYTPSVLPENPEKPSDNPQKPTEPTECRHEKAVHVTDQKEATCAEAGYTLDILICASPRGDAYCGKIFADEKAVKDDDPIGEVEYGVNPEYYFDGNDLDDFAAYRKPIQTLPHTPVKDEAVPATCSEKGLTEGSHCGVCEAVITEQRETDYAAHDYSDTIILASEGSRGVCVTCGQIENDDRTIKASLNEDKSSYTVIGTSGTWTSVDFSEITYNGKPFTQLGENAFYQCDSLVSVKLGGIETVGEWAFSRCNRLETVLMTNDTTSLARGAFSSCDSLTEIVVPDSVTSIGRQTFAGCNRLETITIPFVGTSKTVTNLYDDSNRFSYIFDSGSNLGTLDWNVPASLKTVIVTGGDTIGENAFSYCSDLTSITLPDTLTKIVSRAFYGCSSLTEIVIPDSVTSIGGNAFTGCSSLTNITLPFAGTDGEGVGDISIRDIFSENYKTLKMVTIHGGTKIDKFTFSEFSGLTSVSLPDSITEIGEGAFRECISLKNITIPKRVTDIGSSAFSGCSSLTEIAIPDGVTIIGNSAFYGCSGLTNIVIPDKVTSIGNWAFYGCSGLTEITIPDGITSIGEYAFRGCNGLTTITIPNGITSMGDNVFQDCNKLIIYCLSKNKPDGWAENWNRYRPVIWDCLHNSKDKNGYEYVSINGLQYCLKDSEATVMTQANSSAESIVIPESILHNDETYCVTAINQYAFSDCRNLESLTIPKSITFIPSLIFDGCNKLKRLVVEDGNSRYHSAGNCVIETEDLSLVLGCTNSVIPNDGSVISIAGNAFYGCIELTAIDIPDSVMAIDASSFRNCTDLASITFSENMMFIALDAFLNCTNLTSIIYSGTKEQWYAIEKDDGWDNDTGDYTVHCTDGDIAKGEANYL